MGEEREEEEEEGVFCGNKTPQGGGFCAASGRGVTQTGALHECPEFVQQSREGEDEEKEEPEMETKIGEHFVCLCSILFSELLHFSVSKIGFAFAKIRTRRAAAAAASSASLCGLFARSWVQ